MAQLPKRLKENKHILYALYKADPKLRKAIIKHSKDNLIKALAEISLNTLKGNIQHTPYIFKKLRTYKKKLRAMACPQQSIKAKRKILVQTGGFLPTLIWESFSVGNRRSITKKWLTYSRKCIWFPRKVCESLRKKIN